MGKNKSIVHLVELNIATLILGTSGPLGKLITLPPEFIIWGRCIIGGAFLFLIARIFREDLKVDWKKHWHFFAGTGLLMGLHWVTYFYALQYANVALAQISMFTFPVITTLLEPLILKTRFHYFNFIGALLVLTGIIIMVPEFSLANTGTIGLLFGVFSALIFSLRNIFNKQYIHIYSGMTMMFYQLVIISVLLLPSTTMVTMHSIDNKDLWTILVLGLLTTAIGHTMFTHSFKHFAVSTASIINSMTPIYGTLMAFLFLNESPAGNTLIGGGVIIATVIFENARSYAGKKL